MPSCYPAIPNLKPYIFLGILIPIQHKPFLISTVLMCKITSLILCYSLFFNVLNAIYGSELPRLNAQECFLSTTNLRISSSPIWLTTRHIFFSTKNIFLMTENSLSYIFYDWQVLVNACWVLGKVEPVLKLVSLMVEQISAHEVQVCLALVKVSPVLKPIFSAYKKACFYKVAIAES